MHAHDLLWTHCVTNTSSFWSSFEKGGVPPFTPWLLAQGCLACVAQGLLGLFWLGLHLCVPWTTGNARCRPHITHGVCLHTLDVVSSRIKIHIYKLVRSWDWCARGIGALVRLAHERLVYTWYWRTRDWCAHDIGARKVGVHMILTHERLVCTWYWRTRDWCAREISYLLCW